MIREETTDGLTLRKYSIQGDQKRRHKSQTSKSVIVVLNSFNACG